MMHTGRYFTGAALVGYAILQVLGRRAGATAEERRRALPGDEVVTEPHMVTNHAITIDAPPEDVWPWLTQMGWHRGGYYTPRHVSNAWNKTVLQGINPRESLEEAIRQINRELRKKQEEFGIFVPEEQ